MNAQPLTFEDLEKTIAEVREWKHTVQSRVIGSDQRFMAEVISKTSAAMPSIIIEGHTATMLGDAFQVFECLGDILPAGHVYKATEDYANVCNAENLRRRLKNQTSLPMDYNEIDFTKWCPPKINAGCSDPLCGESFWADPGNDHALCPRCRKPAFVVISNDPTHVA